MNRQKFNRLLALPSLRYEAEAIAIFDKWTSLGTPATKARKLLVNNTIKSLKANSLWATRDVLYVDVAHSQDASLVDWKNPTTRAQSTSGTMTFTVDDGWAGNGSTGRMITGFNPGDGGTYNFTRDDNSIGAYIATRVDEVKILFSAMNTGSTGIDLLPSTTAGSLTTGARNNEATQRTITTYGGRGYLGTKRTASNLWKVTHNGYNNYPTGAFPTDASLAIENFDVARFCRSIAGAFSFFTSRKQRYFQAGASMDEFLFNKIMEKEFLIPLGLCPTTRIIFNGNSFTSNSAYTARVLSVIGYTYEIYNRGISGQTTPQMTTDALATIIPFTKSFITKDICFAWELTNDMTSGASPNNATVCYNNIVAYCVQHKATYPSGKLIIATMLPRTGATNRQNDADLFDDATLNGKIRNHLVQDGYCDAICDVATDSAMGQNLQNLDVTWYNADTIHPLTVGYERLADNFITPSIQAFL